MMEKVVCEKRSYSKKITTHDHEYGQFLFPLQGSLELNTDKRMVNLSEGHCLYLPPNCLHLFRSLNVNEFLVVDIPTIYFQNEHEQSEIFMKMDSKWNSLLFLLLEELKEQKGNSSAVSHLVQYMAKKLEKPSYPSIAYIHKHYKETIRVEELAKLEHYHPAYYSAWFKDVTGKSPVQYIQSLKLKEAKRLLLETDWSITRISQEVGFEHASSLTRLFLKQEQMTPVNFRKIIK
ncbi:AraC family transcriptional regulator [Bacillus sp. FJAT-47783]|uniref:AraC family transcriptional regulator n=1 Tax=Bacillus sp. FJAT-47783 TaxID=2922712 RepID=UPI001FABDD04|nr:AraC family transcriptional regulator [Bacillus sp. FJAT-47783]